MASLLGEGGRLTPGLPPYKNDVMEALMNKA
jgi:hypothetical protein